MRHAWLWAGAAVCGLTAPAAAQTSLEQFERRLEQIQRETELLAEEAIPPEQRALFDYGGFLTFNLFAIDDPDQSTHILRQTALSGYARVNFDNVHEFFLRGQARYDDFNSGDSFDGEGDADDVDLERAFYKFDLRRYIAANEGRSVDYNLTFTGGRQLAHWANGLVLSREIDGVLTTFSQGPLSIDALAGVSRPDTFDIDSSRPEFDDETQRGFFGGKLTWEVSPKLRPYIYGLAQEDYNDEDFDPDPLKGLRAMDPTVPFLPTRFEYDSHYIGGGVTGSFTDQLLYSVEAVYEGGEGLSNSFVTLSNGEVAAVSQELEDIRAWAFDARLNYLFHDANRTRANFEVLLASGDDDRGHTTNTFNGNRPGTDDNAFNGFGLINTGLAFSPNVSNLIMVRTGLATVPFPDNGFLERLQVGADLFVFNKLDSDAPISEFTSDDHYLGVETDFFANWQITSDLSVALRYGVFFPGTAIETDHDARHFAFAGITYSF